MAARASIADPQRTRSPTPTMQPSIAQTEGIAPSASIEEVAAAARGCRACPLWKTGTQTVFGAGPCPAPVMLIGEQPGDREDLTGEPFVGPAGRLLDRALGEVGLDRGRLYVTNTVKHFKFEPRGKRRLHKRANAAEQAACRRWLQAELERVRPQRIVCLGSMAAQAVFGRDFRLLRERGRWRDVGNGVVALATVHPSYVLRQRGDDAREAAYREFARDLTRVAQPLPTAT